MTRAVLHHDEQDATQAQNRSDRSLDRAAVDPRTVDEGPIAASEVADDDTL